MLNSQLRSKKLHELLAETLEELILNGTYAVGRSLPSAQAIATQYGVSQTVVRDAVRQLAAKGLVEVRQGVGAFVTKSGQAGLIDSLRLAMRRHQVPRREIREMRSILEVQIAGLAAARRTQEDLEHFRDVLARYEAVAATAPWEETVQLHLQFHSAMIVATHNGAFTVLMGALTELFLMGLEPEEPGEAAVLTYKQHAHIFACIESGDVESARQAMQEHFDHPWAWRLRPPEKRHWADEDGPEGR